MIVNAGNRIMNTYVYPIEGGYVMVDTGCSGYYKSVESKLKAFGIEMSQIKYVFLTHAHDDHAGFLNELLTKVSGVKVIMNEKSLQILRQGQNSFTGGCTGMTSYLFCRMMAFCGVGKHLFPPIEKRFEDRLVFVSQDKDNHHAEAILGGKILFTPGHTFDSISLKLGDSVLCGDAAMNGFPSQNHITIWMEDKVEFRKSWEYLLSQNVKLLYPSHGNPFEVDELKKLVTEIDKVKIYSLI